MSDSKVTPAWNFKGMLMENNSRVITNADATLTQKIYDYGEVSPEQSSVTVVKDDDIAHFYFNICSEKGEPAYIKITKDDDGNIVITGTDHSGTTQQTILASKIELTENDKGVLISVLATENGELIKKEAQIYDSTISVEEKDYGALVTMTNSKGTSSEAKLYSPTISAERLEDNTGVKIIITSGKEGVTPTVVNLYDPIVTGKRITGGAEIIIQNHIDEEPQIINLYDAGSSSIAPEYDETQEYKKFNYCIYNNTMYVCLGDTTGPFDETKWKETKVSYELDNVSLKIVAEDWDDSKTYSIGDYVMYDKILYKCISNEEGYSLDFSNTISPYYVHTAGQDIINNGGYHHYKQNNEDAAGGWYWDSNHYLVTFLVSDLGRDAVTITRNPSTSCNYEEIEFYGKTIYIGSILQTSGGPSSGPLYNAQAEYYSNREDFLTSFLKKAGVMSASTYPDITISKWQPIFIMDEIPDIATTEKAGIVKVGNNLTIEEDGTLSANADLSIIAEEWDKTKTYSIGDYVLYNNILYKCINNEESSETSYPDITVSKWQPVLIMDEIKNKQSTVPIASTEIAGIVKVGKNLEITEDGTLNAKAGGGNANEMELTWAEYLALTDEEKNNGTTYYITDKNPTSSEKGFKSTLLATLNDQPQEIDFNNYDLILYQAYNSEVNLYSSAVFMPSFINRAGNIILSIDVTDRIIIDSTNAITLNAFNCAIDVYGINFVGLGGEGGSGLPEVYIGDTEPTDDNIQLFVDTSTSYEPTENYSETVLWEAGTPLQADGVATLSDSYFNYHALYIYKSTPGDIEISPAYMHTYTVPTSALKEGLEIGSEGYFKRYIYIKGSTDGMSINCTKSGTDNSENVKYNPAIYKIVGIKYEGLTLVEQSGGGELPSVKQKYHNYSTDEQIVGTWIDGRNVYEKVINMENATWSQEIIIQENVDIIVEENLYYSDSTLQNGSFIPCKGFPQINYWFYPHLTYLRSDNNLIFRLDKCDGTLTIKGVIKYVKLENIQ